MLSIENFLSLSYICWEKYLLQTLLSTALWVLDVLGFKQCIKDIKILIFIYWWHVLLISPINCRDQLEHKYLKNPKQSNLEILLIRHKNSSSMMAHSTCESHDVNLWTAKDRKPFWVFLSLSPEPKFHGPNSYYNFGYCYV